MRTTVNLKGTKKTGYIVTITDQHGFKYDLAITHEEALILKRILTERVAE